jgi:hypothetical protein
MATFLSRSFVGFSTPLMEVARAARATPTEVETRRRLPDSLQVNAP